MRYCIRLTGYVIVEANTEEEAENKYNNGDYLEEDIDIRSIDEED